MLMDMKAHVGTKLIRYNWAYLLTTVGRWTLARCLAVLCHVSTIPTIIMEITTKDFDLESVQYPAFAQASQFVCEFLDRPPVWLTGFCKHSKEAESPLGNSTFVLHLLPCGDNLIIPWLLPELWEIMRSKNPLGFQCKSRRAARQW